MTPLKITWDDRVNLFSLDDSSSLIEQRSTEGGSLYLKDPKSVAPGAAKWLRRDDGKPSYLAFICPCGCGNVSYVPVFREVNLGSNSWKWDGNEQLPTLTPSIRKLTPCGWHGFLTAGEWRTC